jgi:hypothetical protein
MILTKSLAQSSPEGTYYMEGVMETASVITLKSDNTFDFFFSQGALDRTGKGKWSMQDNKVILDSEGPPAAGFEMVKSEVTKNRNYTVVINESNSMLLSFIYARIAGNTEATFLKLGTDGKIDLEGKSGKIELLFELCPERIHEFSPVKEGDNYFEFTISPKILEVHFDKVTLAVSPEGLTGKNPLLAGESYLYRKE